MGNLYLHFGFDGMFVKKRVKHLISKKADLIHQLEANTHPSLAKVQEEDRAHHAQCQQIELRLSQLNYEIATRIIAEQIKAGEQMFDKQKHAIVEAKLAEINEQKAAALRRANALEIHNFDQEMGLESSNVASNASEESYRRMVPRRRSASQNPDSSANVTVEDIPFIEMEWALSNSERKADLNLIQ